MSNQHTPSCLTLIHDKGEAHCVCGASEGAKDNSKDWVPSN